jgi:cation transport regulator ChaC
VRDFLYFAYGSNLLTTRLRARCPSAAFQTTATAAGYEVSFGKKSVDGSGKATLRHSGQSGDGAIGAVFRISESELTALDRAEGVDYRRDDAFHVRCRRGGESLDVVTYVAKELHDELRPYDWYLALVVAGAAEHRLPAGYVARLCSRGSIPDPDSARRARRDALAALAGAGIDDFATVLAGR